MPCQNIFKESLEQLRADGYHASISTPEIVADTIDIDDGQSLGYEAPPNDLLGRFQDLVEQRKCPPLSKLTLQLADIIAAVEAAIRSAGHSFESPVWDHGGKPVKQWSSIAYAAGAESKALAKAWQLLEHLYEATRLIVVTKQAALELAFLYLEMTGVLTLGAVALWQDELSRMPGSWSRAKAALSELDWLWPPTTRQRMAHLKKVRWCQKLLHTLNQFGRSTCTITQIELNQVLNARRCFWKSARHSVMTCAASSLCSSV